MNSMLRIIVVTCFISLAMAAIVRHQPIGKRLHRMNS